MNKHLFFCLILSAACLLEAAPMRLGEGDATHSHLEQTQEAQRRDAAIGGENDGFSDQVLRDQDASVGEEQGDVFSKCQAAAEEIQSALGSPDVSRIFMPSIQKRTWGEYFQTSFVEARAREKTSAILKQVDATMDQSLSHACQEAEEVHQSLQPYQNRRPILIDVTTKNQLELAVTSAQQAAWQVKMAKSPTAYTLSLAQAIAQMLEDAKVRNLPQINEDGTYQNIETRERWELDQTCVDRLAVPSATAYALCQILSEAAEQALLETIVDRISHRDHETIPTLEELFSDECIAAAANAVAMSRVAVIEAENVDFQIAKAQGPRVTPWGGDPLRGLLKIAHRVVETAQEAHAAMSKVNHTRENYFFDPSVQGVLMKKAADAVMIYRKQNHIDHANYLKKMQREGDCCYSDPYFEYECPKKIRRPIQQYHDVALRRQIESRLAGYDPDLSWSYLHENIVEESQWHQRQLQEIRKMAANLAGNAPRYRGEENGSESFCAFVFSVSRGLEAPNFFYGQMADYTCRELEAAAASYCETDSASLIRMILEISVAHALPNIIANDNADTAMKNGKIYAEYERRELNKLSLRVCNSRNNTSLTDRIITSTERTSLNTAISAIVGSSLISSSVPVEKNWNEMAKLQQLLTEENSTNNSSIDFLLAMRRIMSPDQASTMVQAAKEALPVVTKLFQHSQQQATMTVQAALVAQISKLNKAITAAADFLDEQE